MARSGLGLIMLFTLALASIGAAGAQPVPEFKLGFKALAEMIPDVVGQPLENEHHDEATGDTLQRTSTGLMVWRKADNWTAFTDGFRTWVNGPFGLQERGNDERFPWEKPVPTPSAEPAPATAPTPTPASTPTATPTAMPKPNLRVSALNVVAGQDLHRDSLWILGEIHNDGHLPAYNAKVTARLLSFSGDVAASVDQQFDYLGPGDGVGYRMEVRNPPAYARVELSVDSSATGLGRFVRLPITWVKNEKVVSGAGDIRYEFTGTLDNPGGQVTSLNVVYVWFLDDQGRVVWMDYTYLPATYATGEPRVFTLRTPLDRYNPQVPAITQVRYYATGRGQ